MDPDATGVLPIVELDPPTHRGAVKPSLVCVSGADLGRSFKVGNSVVIGRGAAEVALSEGDVSRRHARIRFGEYGYEIEDLGSSNGTIVNGERIAGRVVIHLGDRIQIGRAVLVFAQHDELAERVAHVQRLEAMATMAGGIAHDFNNALAVVLCNLDDIERALPGDARDARESLDEVRRATGSATSLARRLLRLGRAEPLSFGAVAIEQMIQQTAAMARRRGQGIAIVIDVPADLRALGSYDELHQVVLNLCINAIDAMPTGGRLAITARTMAFDAGEALARQLATAGEYIEIAVADTGTGMDEATIARAFEPFFTTKPKGKGTGLGLAMIHQTVRRHGGAIDVQSIVGIGTTFRIVLPKFVLTAV
ncbi:MAG: ATP-binding protein [Kofleriaceae bacterium]